MRIILNGLVFGNREEVKFLEEKMESTKMVESDFCINKDNIKGTFKDIQLNKVFIVYQEIKGDEPLEYKINHNTPLFKLHIQKEGDFNCSFEDHKNTNISILEGSYNLFYVPKSNMTSVYYGKSKSFIGVYFTEGFMESIMGKPYVEAFKELKTAKLKKIPFALLNDGLQINKSISTLINSITNCDFKEVMKKSFLEAKIAELLLVALTNESKKVLGEPIEGLELNNLEKVEYYIQQNVKKELTITDLSVLAGMNTTKFKKCFKQFYGSTVFKYITSLRIEKAKDLIQRKNYTISQASYEVGYKNPQHFTVAFKKKLGYLPSELKKN